VVHPERGGVEEEPLEARLLWAVVQGVAHDGRADRREVSPNLVEDAGHEPHLHERKGSLPSQHLELGAGGPTVGHPEGRT